MLGCRRPPPAQSEAQCGSPKLPCEAGSFCSTCGLLSASPSLFGQGTEELFRGAVMKLFHLYFSKDLKHSKHSIFAHRLVSHFSFLLMSRHRLAELEVTVQVIGTGKALCSVFYQICSFYMNKHLQREPCPGRAES